MATHQLAGCAARKMPAIKYQNDTNYLSLSGKIFGATAQDLNQGAFLLAILDNKNDTSRRMEQLGIEQNGTFSNPDIILYDTTKVYYKLLANETLANSSAVNFNSSMPSPGIAETDTLANVLFSDTTTTTINAGWLKHKCAYLRCSKAQHCRK
jgi:hypothetical protein